MIKRQYSTMDILARIVYARPPSITMGASTPASPNTPSSRPSTLLAAVLYACLRAISAPHFARHIAISEVQCITK